MVWTPKSGTPSVFNLATALAATITGDASLAWLTQFIPWVSGVSVSTTDFCAAGPPTSSPLVLSDFVPPLTTDGAALFAWQQNLSLKLELFARDRQFGAFCELLGAPAGGVADWTLEDCHDLVHVGSGGDWRIVNGAPIPPASTRFRIRMVVAPTGGAPTSLVWNPGGIAWGLDTLGTTVGTREFDIPLGPGAGHTWSWDIHGPGTSNFCLQWNYPPAGSVTDHAPAAQANPGLPAPLTTGADLVSMAHELDRQEGKLDFLIGLAQLATASNPTLAGAPGTPVTVAAGGEPIPLDDAIGVVVALTGVPAGAIRLSGNPTQLVRCGYINFGTADAWYPSIPITHTPMVIQPLPPLTTRMSATIYPPSSGTITPILRPK